MEKTWKRKPSEAPFGCACPLDEAIGTPLDSRWDAFVRVCG